MHRPSLPHGVSAASGPDRVTAPVVRAWHIVAVGGRRPPRHRSGGFSGIRRVKPSWGRRLWMVPLAGLTVATLLAAGLAWSQSPSALTWPASIVPIAAFVSHDRGLAFLHPVPVHFQSPRTFDRQTAAQDQPDGATQKAEVLLQAAE